MPSQRHDFGKYKLLRRIAAGGMGEVHLAKLVGPSGFEKLVVIKRLLQSRQSEQKYVDMFFAEARVAAQLGHSNIVQVYEVGTIDGVPYIAMEYVHGKSLRKVLDRALKRPTAVGPHGVPPGFTAHIISQLCLGLAFAHDARHLSGATIGLVHRDINPHNVLISYQGEVKIIDFGIAKSELSLDQTQAGTIKGTVVYMSPEQSLGEKLDKRSDLFSVGICLYEALTGTNPFHKSGMGASLEAIRQAEYPPLDAERKELSPFAAILGRALAKHRTDRFADCSQLADALKLLLESGQVPRPPVPLAAYMAELFGQEMLEEEQLLERTDMVRNPLLHSQVALGTQPIARPTEKDSAQDFGDAVEHGEHFAATQADIALVPEPTVAQSPPRPPHQAALHKSNVIKASLRAGVVAPSPIEASRSNTPNPLMALARPLWPSGQRLMGWAEGLSNKPTMRLVWPYAVSFILVFAVMGTLAVVTQRKPRMGAAAASDAVMEHVATPTAAASAHGAPDADGHALTPAASGTVLGTAEPAGIDDLADGTEVTTDIGDDADTEQESYTERRGRRRRGGRSRGDSPNPAGSSGTNPKVQVKAEPPLVVQYDNTVVDEEGARLKGITGTLRVGQNPEADSFIITLNYRLTPRGISYQIDSTPWADVTGPGGVLLGRTPLRWTEPSQLLSLEFTNPHSAQAQRLTLRVMH